MNVDDTETVKVRRKWRGAVREDEERLFIHISTFHGWFLQ